MGFDRSEIDELLADIRQATQSARQAAAEQHAERERFRAQTREFDEERAEAARRGDHGADWRVVQGRIDRGETSLSRVLSGQDDSPEAQRILDLTATNLVEIAHESAEFDEATGGERFTDVVEAFESLRASMERAGRAVLDLRADGGPEGGEQRE